MTSASTDPLEDPAVWHDLIMGFVNHPMNYGADIHAVGTIALAAGIDPQRAVAKVETFYHHNASHTLQ